MWPKSTDLSSRTTEKWLVFMQSLAHQILWDTENHPGFLDWPSIVHNVDYVAHRVHVQVSSWPHDFFIEVTAKKASIPVTNYRYSMNARMLRKRF
jgi:hypothetical protein